MTQKYKTTNQVAGEPIYFEQIAVQTRDSATTIENYKQLGHTDWIEDEVHAKNIDGTLKGTEFKARLFFNYTVFPGKEYEIIELFEGESAQYYPHDNFSPNGEISHMGLHVENIEEYIAQNELLRNSELMQLTETQWHKGTQRRYFYALVNTIASLGFITKLIQRKAE